MRTMRITMTSCPFSLSCRREQRRSIVTLILTTLFLITSRASLTTAASAFSLLTSSSGSSRHQHPFLSSLFPEISSSTFSNYSFPDSPDAVITGQVYGEDSVVTDVFGHHMHVMEGDIAVSDDIENEVDESRHDWRKAKKANFAINNDFRIWPKGKIPYVIDGSLLNAKGKILKGMRHIESKTCVTFVPRRNEKNYVRIYQGGYRSCYSMIGRMGGGQGISLGNGCLIHGVIVHELMHAIGFYHQHSRSDRDKYVQILWQNINPSMQSQFRRNAPTQDLILRPFDYNSIMLYGPKLFSSNGRDTMVPKKRGIRLLDTGVKSGLSDEDARSINMLYGCSSRRDVHEKEEEDAVSPTTPVILSSSTSSTSSTTSTPPKRRRSTVKSVNKPRRRWSTSGFRTSTYKPVTKSTKSTSKTRKPSVKPEKNWKYYDRLETTSPDDDAVVADSSLLF